MSKAHPGCKHSLPTHGPEVTGRGDTRGPALVRRRLYSRPRRSVDPGTELAALGETPAGHRCQPFPPAQRPQPKALRSAGRPSCGCSPEPPPRGLANSGFPGAVWFPSTLPQNQAKEKTQRAPDPEGVRAEAAGLRTGRSPPARRLGESRGAGGFLVPFGGELGSRSPVPVVASFLCGTT